MWKQYCAGLVLTTSLTPQLWAQLPAAAGAAAAPAAAAGAPAAAGAAAGAAKPGLFMRLLDAKAACRERLCRSQLGLLLNNTLKPIGAFSGGLVPELCPPIPTKEDLAKPATSSEGAAARIKADEAAAKERRAAVRYLGTVDCHWWPEAEAGLITGLRFDRNECVRLEAALALSRGCCCTKKTIKALQNALMDNPEDGNPSENSERVRAAAHFALARCLACYAEVSIEPVETPPETKPEIKPEIKPETPDGVPTADKGSGATGQGSVGPVAYYQRVERLPLAQVVEDARKFLARSVPAANREMVQGNERPSANGVIQIVMNAMTPPASAVKSPVHVPMAEPAPAPEPAIQPAVPKPGLKPLGDLRAPKAEPKPLSDLRAPTTEPKPLSNLRLTGSYEPPVRPDPVAGPALTMPAVASAMAFEPPPPNWDPEPEQPSAPASETTSVAPSAIAANIQQLVVTLQDSLYPEQREWAALNLAGVDWARNQHVVAPLVAAARKDPNGSVRATCVRSLVKMNANTPAVVTAFQELKADADPRVRGAAQEGLTRFQAARPRLVPQSHQPAGAGNWGTSR
jgi:hypothetical protein